MTPEERAREAMTSCLDDLARGGSGSREEHIAAAIRADRADENAALRAEREALLAATKRTVRLMLEADAGERDWLSAMADARILLCIAIAAAEGGGE